MAAAGVEHGRIQRDMRVGRTTGVVINRLECTQVQLQYVVGTQRVAGATDRHDPPRILESAQQRGLHDVGRGRGPTRTGIRLQLLGVWPYRNAWRIQCRVAQRPVDHQLPLRSEERTSELQSRMRISYAGSGLQKKQAT